MAPVDDRESRSDDRASSTSSPGQETGVDLLSDVLRNVRLSGAVFFVWEAGAPFANAVPEGRRLAPALLPRARQIVSYHVVVEGSCWGGLAGEAPIPLRAGDVLLVPRGDAYVIASSAEACRRTPVDEAAALGFFAAMTAGDLPLMVREDGGGGGPATRLVCGFLGCDVQPFNPVLAALPPLLRLTACGGAADERLRRLVEHALAEAAEPTPGSGTVLARLGELMFVEVLRRCLRQPDDPPHAWLAALEDPVVGRCLALIHRRPTAPWTLVRLAAAVASSRSGLAQRFVERVGMPPIEYLTRWRIQMAANLLEDTPAKVATVAERVGYGSAAALTRAFKRVVGATPGEWRERGIGASICHPSERRKEQRSLTGL